MLSSLRDSQRDRDEQNRLEDEQSYKEVKTNYTKNVLAVEQEKIDALQKELSQYFELKDHREKYLEAERLMGKAFLLLMANLSLATTKEQKEWLEKSQSKSEQIKKAVSVSQDFACPENVEDELPKERGPEVIIDPYGKESACPKCKKCPKASLSFTSDMRKKFLKNNDGNPFPLFSDDDLNFLKPSRILDFDIHSELFEGSAYAGELNQALPSHVKEYLGDWTGEFYSEGELSPIRLRVTIAPAKKKKPVNLLVEMAENGVNDPFFSFSSTLLASHPVSHNHQAGGSCRGLVLNSEFYQIHLMRIYKLQNGLSKQFLYARVFRKTDSSKPSDWSEKGLFAASTPVASKVNGQGKH